jgi:hypothetical protein
VAAFVKDEDASAWTLHCERFMQATTHVRLLAQQGHLPDYATRAAFNRHGRLWAVVRLPSKVGLEADASESRGQPHRRLCTSFGCRTLD